MAATGPFTGKIHHQAGGYRPEGTSWSENGRAFARFVADKTGGRAKVIWYLGGVMGDEPDVIRKIRMGQIQGGGFTLVGLGKMAPEVKVLELPFLFRSYEEVDHVLGNLNPTFSRIFRKKGYVLAGWLEVGFVRFFTRTPIHSLNDLNRTKMWTWAEDALAEAALKALGLRTIIPLNITEVLSSLQTGLVDAYYGPSYATLALQWHTQAKYMTEFPFAYTPAAIVMDKKFYDSLSPDIRRVLEEGWRTFLPELVVRIRNDERASLESLKSSGIVMTQADEDFLREARARALPLYREHAGVLYPPSLLERTLFVLEDFRKKRAPSP